MPNDHEQVADQTDDGADTQKAPEDSWFPRLTPDPLMKLEKHRRQRERRERFNRFMERSRLGWLLHPAPFDDYFQFLPLPPKLEAAHARFVRRLSWFALLRKRSERMYQLGLGGLVMAPLIAWLVLHGGPVHEQAFPVQLGFLFFSGLAYVLACAWVAWRCPDLVREVSERKANYDPDRQLHWRVLVEEEILALRSLRAYPISVAFDEHMESFRGKRAKEFFMGGIVPHQVGFGAFGRYRLEEAILACAQELGLEVYEETLGPYAGLTLVEGPSKVMESREPYVVSLSVRLPTDDELAGRPNRWSSSTRRVDQALEEDENEPSTMPSLKPVPPGSLIVHWSSAAFEFRRDALMDISLAVKHIHGLRVLYEVIGIDRLAEVVAGWQGRRHLLSRLFAGGLYLLALVAFGAFLSMQSWIVLQALIKAM